VLVAGTAVYGHPMGIAAGIQQLRGSIQLAGAESGPAGGQ
jgi:ribulose 1,5-bisphosphate carboxylase large subunit-like protein